MVKSFCVAVCHINRLRFVLEGFLILAWVGALVAVNATYEPKRQGFFCEDLTLRHPYKRSTVPNAFLTAVTIGVPALLMALTEVACRLSAGLCKQAFSLSGTPRSPSGWRVLGNYLTYFFGYTAMTLTVVVLKLSTGTLRPHFLAVCKPDVDLDTCTGYVSDYNCTNVEEDDRIVQAARKSFPSGHAASAVYMSLFLMLYFEQRLPLLRFPLLKLTSFALLASYALWCSATRIGDNYHHLTDVVVGFLLGALFAAATFYRAVLSGMTYDSTSARAASLRRSGCNGGGYDNDNEAIGSIHVDLSTHDNSESIGCSHVDPSTPNNLNNSHHRSKGDHESTDNTESDDPSTPTPLLQGQVQYPGLLRPASMDRNAYSLTTDKAKFHKFPRKFSLF